MRIKRIYEYFYPNKNLRIFANFSRTFLNQRYQAEVQHIIVLFYCYYNKLLYYYIIILLYYYFIILL